jgi:hypothetical protein
MLNPVFTLLAKKAKRNGTEETLLKEYYYRAIDEEKRAFQRV